MPNEQAAQQSEPEPERLPGIGRIHAAMAAVMGEVGGVAKGRKNDQQGYKYRGVADITKACQLVMARNGVTLVPHTVRVDAYDQFQTAKGAVMFKARQTITWRFYHSDGSYVQAETTGEGMDSGDKATNKAMTASQKYVLTQAFSIPEEDPDDSEKDSPEVVGKAPQSAPKPGPRPVPSPPPAATRPATKPAGPYIEADDLQRVFATARSVGLNTPKKLQPVLDRIAGAWRAEEIPQARLDAVLEELVSIGETGRALVGASDGDEAHA